MGVYCFTSRNSASGDCDGYVVCSKKFLGMYHSPGQARKLAGKQYRQRIGIFPSGNQFISTLPYYQADPFFLMSP